VGFIRQVIHGEAPRHGLLVERIGIAIERVELAGLGLAFRADDVFDTPQLQQVAQLGRVDDIRRVDGDLLPGVLARHGHGAQIVPVRFDGDGPVTQQNIDLLAGAKGRQHFFQHGQGHARLVTQPADMAPAGVEVHDLAGLEPQRVVAAVVVADALGEAAVGVGAAGGLDPRVLVRRDGLGGELPADPIGFLGHDHFFAQPQHGERRSHAAQSPANDQHIGLSLFHRQPFRPETVTPWTIYFWPKAKITSMGTIMNMDITIIMGSVLPMPSKPLRPFRPSAIVHIS